MLPAALGTLKSFLLKNLEDLHLCAPYIVFCVHDVSAYISQQLGPEPAPETTEAAGLEPWIRQDA